MDDSYELLRKKPLSIPVVLELDIDKWRLEDISRECFEHACSTPYVVGSNYWMTAFSDHLQILLQKHARLTCTREHP